MQYEKTDFEFKCFSERSDHSGGLEIFLEKAKKIASELDEKYPFLEIGTRNGATALLLLKAIKESSAKRRMLITVDSYGDYPSLDIMKVGGDGDHFMKLAMLEISKYCYDNDLRHTHFRMISKDFMKIFPTLHIWREYQEFSFIYLDGNHNHSMVEEELQWSLKRIAKNGIISIDDMAREYEQPTMKKFRSNGEFYGHNRGFVKYA